MRYMRWQKVSIITQTRASFPSCPCKLQVTVSDNYGKCSNCDKHSLESLFQCALLHCGVKHLQLGAWTREDRRLVLCNGNHNGPVPPIGDDIFKIILFSFWCTIFVCQLKLNSRWWHLELVVVYAL